MLQLVLRVRVMGIRTVLEVHDQLMEIVMVREDHNQNVQVEASQGVVRGRLPIHSRKFTSRNIRVSLKSLFDPWGIFLS